ncbi:imidazole glycerol phosphate synthase subunit HisH [Candidatus Woesearchaeota archaeon]|nr:imidazole glycerol phosphate synthase subunit HisH [Candidatus Woesearchaeota archaeon]
MQNYEIPDVSIIDYGINNLKSVNIAFQSIGRTAKIIDAPEDVQSAKCLVLPGIGAFHSAMENLRKKSLTEPIRQKVKDGTPILGICLGMQLLFSESEEFGLHKGLGLVPGRVIPFKSPKEINIKGYKVPHIGWSELIFQKNSVKNTLLENLPEQCEVYFVHSYFPKADDAGTVLATAKYGGQEFCAIVKKGNITGTQFHPEKSGEIGLSMLRTFCNQNCR